MNKKATLQYFKIRKIISGPISTHVPGKKIARVNMAHINIPFPVALLITLPKLAGIVFYNNKPERVY